MAIGYSILNSRDSLADLLNGLQSCKCAPGPGWEQMWNEIGGGPGTALQAAWNRSQSPYRMIEVLTRARRLDLQNTAHKAVANLKKSFAGTRVVVTQKMMADAIRVEVPVAPLLSSLAPGPNP